MNYVHQYFRLDPNSRKVFDINNKELYLTGNAYRVLVFLCRKKNATLTEIGDALDWAKDYDENNIRQYKYKINTIIGHPVIEYKNGIYSLVGQVTESQISEPEQRNTFLLQSHAIYSDGMKKKIQLSKWPAAIAIVILALSFAKLPYGFYTFLRLSVTIVALYYAYSIYELNSEVGWSFWALIVIAIAFNPLIPIYIKNRAEWQGIDVAVAVFFAYLTFRLKKSPKTAQSP